MFLRKIVLWLYSFIFTISLPLVFLRLLWRSRKNTGYRQHWLERLGLSPFHFNIQDCLWLHAVSLGETMAAAPLIRAIQKQFPTMPIVITSTTPTGRAQVTRLFGNSVFQLYCPLDLPWALTLFLNKIQPKLCVLMETELWPNMLCNLKKRGIPIVLASARLSQKSMLGYKKIKGFTKDMLQAISKVAAQSKEDGERFVELGLDKNKLTIVGNIKFDVTLPKNVEELGSALKTEWGIKRPVLIAASTHAGEEEIILWVFSELKKEFPNLLLILVPRHPERFNTVAEFIQHQGLNIVRRSQKIPANEHTEVYLGDTMGEMFIFYAASDIAFVGGSLVPVGGHNALEPALLGIPILMGSYTYNCQEITKLLKDAHALIQIESGTLDLQSKEKLFKAFEFWLRNKEARDKAGQNGKQVVLANKGAVEKIINIISACLNSRSK
jgi:3-deoxy-D-manno-octulosonic-acid transferase